MDPVDPVDPVDPGDGSPREFTLDWQWGKQEEVQDFNPAQDTVNIGWIGGGQFEVEQTDDGVLFTLPGNGGRSLLLVGIVVADLTANSILANDAAAQAKIEDFLANAENLADVGTQSEAENVDTTYIPEAPEAPSAPEEAAASSSRDDDAVAAPAEETEQEEGPRETQDAPEPALAAAANNGNGAIGGDTVEINWDWAAEEVITNFDPATDTIDFGNLNASQVQITEENNSVVIEVLDNGGHTYTLNGISADDLTEANFEADDFNTIVTEDGGVVDQIHSINQDDNLI